jgi:hypothetical protein
MLRQEDLNFEVSLGHKEGGKRRMREGRKEGRREGRKGGREISIHT